MSEEPFQARLKPFQLSAAPYAAGNQSRLALSCSQPLTAQRIDDDFDAPGRRSAALTLGTLRVRARWFGPKRRASLFAAACPHQPSLCDGAYVGGPPGPRPDGQGADEDPSLPHCRVQTALGVTGRCQGPAKSAQLFRRANLVDLGDDHVDWEVVGESVLIDRLAHSATGDSEASRCTCPCLVQDHEQVVALTAIFRRSRIAAGHPVGLHCTA
jgi:hypothetical protein